MATIIAFLSFLLIVILLLPIRDISQQYHFHNTLRIIRSEYDERLDSQSGTSVFFRLMSPILAQVSRILKLDRYNLQNNKYEKLIRMANVENVVTLSGFIALKYLTSIFLLLYFLLLSISSASVEIIVLGMITTPIGFILPDQWLKVQIRKRQWQIRKEIPSVLVTMAVITNAGLSLIQSIEEVCKRKPGALTNEWRKTLSEINVGLTQKEAFENMASRILVDELTVILSVLAQAIEKGGSGISTLLKEQANDSWKRRKSKARELGEKASIKLFFPLIGLILPALMIFLLTPAIFTIVRFFNFS